MGKGKKGKKKGAQPPRVDAEAGATPPTTGGDEPTPIVERADVAPAPVATAPRPDTDRQTGGSDRRLFRRVPFFRKVEYRFESMDDFRSQFANDLSLGGMFIKTDEPEPMGTVIFLQFDLQDGSKILSGYGKVVRVNPRGLPDFDPGMGVEFLKFDDESLQRIRQLVAERFSPN
jgi:uncharacterized protein (TIGR02266 family)